MKQNEEEEEIVDERTTIKKRNLNSVYLFLGFPAFIIILIAEILPDAEIFRSSNSSREFLSESHRFLSSVARGVGTSLGLCTIPLIIAFLSSWKKGIYHENFRMVFRIAWIMVVILYFAGEFLK